MSERVLIIGGGHAAGQCAASLRQKGWSGEIIIAGEEPHPPYQRPPLSKAYLAGDMAADRLFYKPFAFYEKEAIDVRCRERATHIDRTGKSVTFESGLQLDYDWLVLATGARVRKLQCNGAALAGVQYLRTIDDVDALKAQFRPGAEMTIIGAGYIGLEVAASARKCGLNVTVFELADRVMARVTGETVSHFFEDLHRAHGVDLRLQQQIEAFEGDRQVQQV
ncbi:MAG: NAD(P)/FAD-dependent oxidoreductase, partial [Hyphococcus sp.]